MNIEEYNNPKELIKQMLFDCAMEIQYHSEGVPDEIIANKILDIIMTMDDIGM